MHRDTLVLTVMSTPPVTAHADTTLSEIERRFNAHDINHIPIVDEQLRPVGMVSSTDLNRLRDWRSFFSGSKGEGPGHKVYESLLASEVMQTPVYTVQQRATLAEVANLINRRNFHCLPVVDNEGAIVGIVTAHDLLRIAYKAENFNTSKAG